MNSYSEVGLPSSGVLHSREATEFLTTVYGWMFFGLCLTSLVAGVVAGSETLVRTIFANPAVYYGLIIAELALVLIVSLGINKLSAGTATLLFLAYSALNGATLSVVLLVFTGGSVLLAFVSAACLFGTMSLYGYVTKRDLTSWGSLLRVGLIALIVCLVVNLFFRSSAFDFAISIVGVMVFLGLTAYDTQKILTHGARAAAAGDGQLRKMAIIGALELYLDFINLFLYLLRFMGKRK